MGTEGKEVLYIREEGKDQSAISSIEYQGVDLSTLAYLHSKAPGTSLSQVVWQKGITFREKKMTGLTKKQASSPLSGNSILRKPLHTEIKSIAITATRSLRYAYPDRNTEPKRRPDAPVPSNTAHGLSQAPKAKPTYAQWLFTAGSQHLTS